MYSAFSRASRSQKIFKLIWPVLSVLFALRVVTPKLRKVPHSIARKTVKFSLKNPASLLSAALLSCSPASAQWLTQTISLKPGWNAIFLHVDASQDSLDSLVGNDSSNPILEVWRWNWASVVQFTDSPLQPGPAVEWASWNRTNASGAPLKRLVGDCAYLVRVSTNVNFYDWSIKGQPVAPRHDWTITGLNLIGFSTVASTPPNFKAFLAPATEFLSTIPEIYYYPGGDLGPNN